VQGVRLWIKRVRRRVYEGFKFKGVNVDLLRGCKCVEELQLYNFQIIIGVGD